MARSSYIYVVLYASSPYTCNLLVAAFTVKHELKDWWKRCTHPHKDEFEVWRIRDGGTKSLRDHKPGVSIPHSELE